MNVAIIPARGGSKRIPKKNTKNFLGKPIISYSIEIAISTNLFDRIIVSTDSEDVAKVAIESGAETPFMRPKELADDFIGNHEVIRHAVNWLDNAGEKIDYTCCIYPTAPLIDRSDLLKGFDLIKTGNWDSVMAATSFSYPIFRSFEKLSNGGLKMIFPEHYNSRSQDLPIVYHDAGQFNWVKPDYWKKNPTGFNEKNSIVEVPYYRVQDIDTFEDWERAEMIYKILRKNKFTL